MKDFMAVLLGNNETVYNISKNLHRDYSIGPIVLTTTLSPHLKYTKIIDVKIDTNLHDQEHFLLVLLDLVRRLKREYKKVILIPCSKSYMDMTVKNQSILSDYDTKFINYAHLEELNDKQSFYTTCSKYDLLHTRVFTCNKRNYKKVITTSDIKYPISLKKTYYEKKNKLDIRKTINYKIINDKYELLKEIKDIYNSDYKSYLIIKEIILSDDSNTFILNTYSSSSGRVIIKYINRAIIHEYNNKKKSTLLALVPVPTIPIIPKITKFLDDIKYKGYSTYIIKLNKDGKYYITDKYYYPYMMFIPTSKYIVEDLVYDNINTQYKDKLLLNIPYTLLREILNNDTLIDSIKSLKQSKDYEHILKYDFDNSIKRRILFRYDYTKKIKYFKDKKNNYHTS